MKKEELKVLVKEQGAKIEQLEKDLASKSASYDLWYKTAQELWSFIFSRDSRHKDS